MEGKFLGIGLKNAMGLFCLFILFIVGLKTITEKYQVPGLQAVMKAV